MLKADVLIVSNVILRLFNINYMIKLNNIHKSFNQNKALDNLCLQVNPGEIYGLLGANGAGKSTTMNLLLGFLKADSGYIEVFDSKNNLIKSSYWFNPVSYFQNEWNALTSTDYNSYKDYRNDIQYAINNKLELLAFECWDERKVSAKLYNKYVKRLRSTSSESQ